MRIVVVLTSHDELGDNGKKTGFWLEEFAAPYYVFKDAGVDISLASPLGGQPPLDPKSDESDAQTAATRRFENDRLAQEALANTVKLANILPDDYDAVFYPGVHGPLWDLAEDSDSITLIETMYAAGKPVAAVCHAPAVLRHRGRRQTDHRAEPRILGIGGGFAGHARLLAGAQPEVSRTLAITSRRRGNIQCIE